MILVIARSAGHVVGTALSVQRVVARQSIQMIVRRCAGQTVGGAIAHDRAGGIHVNRRSRVQPDEIGRAERSGTDAAQPDAVAAGERDNRIAAILRQRLILIVACNLDAFRPRSEVGDHILAVARCKEEPVVAGAADERVVARAADEEVIARIPGEPVTPRRSDQIRDIGEAVALRPYSGSVESKMLFERRLP